MLLDVFEGVRIGMERASRIYFVFRLIGGLIFVFWNDGVDV